MSSVLCITLRFLDPVPQFHGRGDDGEPEWPPSPLRLYQALVAASATRWRESQFRDYARPALQWLEAMSPSILVPPVSGDRFGYRMYVPNNSGDLMTAAWARGDTDTGMAKFRVEKDVRPTNLGGEAVHYLYSIPEGGCPHLNTLQAAARSITHLGWGIDMVAGNAQVLTEEQLAAEGKASRIDGERWQPVADSTDNNLRVPKLGTLDDLLRKHAAFLNRLSGDGFKPVPPLREFNVVGYRRATDPAARLHYAAFRILAADPDDPTTPAFDAARRARDVACWVRNAAGRVCAGEPDAATFVHGHAAADSGKPAKGDGADARLLYLPLPTVNPLRVEAIRRVLVAGPVEHAQRVRQVGRRLEGAELVWEGAATGMLAPLAASDWVLRQYVGSAAVWSTVTPVILPGHDDRDPRKAEVLIRKAFVQAGLSAEVVDGIADLAWRNVGFRAGVDLASKYARPDKLAGQAYHVRVAFARSVVGPLAVGAGRYRGFGVFVADAAQPRRNGR